MNVASLRVALVQHPPVFLNLEASVEKAEHLAEEAASRGASLIAFPETWLPGYPVWLDYSPNVALWNHPGAKTLHRMLFDNAIEIGDRNFRRLDAIAQKTKTRIVMGAHEKRGGTLYNTMFFFDPHGAYVVHRKLMPTHNERLVWGMGDGSTLSVMGTEYGAVGGLVCWEHWMPLARAAMHALHETVHIAQWPSVNELHQLASRHYAFEGCCFVLACGSVLRRDDVIEGIASLDAGNGVREILEGIPEKRNILLKGGSAVIGPDSRYVAEPVFEASETIYADLDLSLIREGNLYMDADGHYSRPDVFRLEVDGRERVNVEFLRRDNPHPD